MPRMKRAATTRAIVPSLLLCLLATSALAQVAPAPKPAPAKAEDSVSEVVVTGQRPAAKSAIDRKIYDVSRDPAAANGSVSDVLRNLPSVDVDVDGNVALRGEASVQILVDGKPSAQFSGATRAQALQSLPANTVETIEVMTNPSAEFSPDGAGGIINIVTKKIRKPGTSGSAQVGAGSGGRWNAGTLGAYNDGPLNLTGGISLSREARRLPGRSFRTRIDPLTDLRTEIEDQGTARYAVKIFNLSAGVDYDTTARDRLSLSGSFLANEGFRTGASAEVRRDDQGRIVSQYEAVGIEPYTFATSRVTAAWRHNFAEPERLFTLNIRRSDLSDDHRNRTDYIYAVPQAWRAEQRDTYVTQAQTNISAAYTQPLAAGGSLKAGVDLSREDVIAGFSGDLFQPDGSRAPLVGVANRFAYAQSNAQAYATWQKPLGKLTALAGLRLEHAGIDYHQAVGGISGDDDYVDIHPSLHLQYALSEAQKLTFSYSHRVNRPAVFQLNPFVRQTDPYNVTAGNPNLHPQETHSVEAEWERQGERGTLSAAVFMRANYNTIGDVDRFISPTVVLHTFENQGESTTGGAEFDATRKLGEDWSFHVNGIVAYSQLERASTAGGETRSAFNYTLKGNLDWRATDKDLFQLSGSYSGKQLTSQGYNLPTGSLNLGYRRRLRTDLVLTATMSDLFETARRVQVFDTPSIFGRGESFGAGRLITIGVTRQLGGKPAKDPSFEYVS